MATMSPTTDNVFVIEAPQRGGKSMMDDYEEAVNAARFTPYIGPSCASVKSKDVQKRRAKNKAARKARKKR